MVHIFLEIVEIASLTNFCWLHIFAELTTIKQKKIITECIEIEDAQEACSQEYDIIGMDVHFGVEGTNSNGSGEGKDDNMNMVENIRNLQKDLQNHKDDNERLMKAKEQ
jgi:hypothetical protein